MVTFATIAAAYMLALLAHEIGHWITALALGIRVERLNLFLDTGRSLQLKIGHTAFGLGWIPTGAYTMLSGFHRPKPAREPYRWEFWGRPLWQRWVVTGAGVKMNMVIASAIHLAFSAGVIYPTLFWQASFAINLLLGVRNILPLGATDGVRLVHLVGDHWFWSTRERRWASAFSVALTIAWAYQLGPTIRAILQAAF